MSLSIERINPLNVFNVRRLTISPPNFSLTHISDESDIQKIEEWIYKKLNSRYSVRKIQKIDSANKIIVVYEIGFEDHKENTLFNLACPHIHK